jgi:KUP system potassium uptake protein
VSISPPTTPGPSHAPDEESDSPDGARAHEPHTHGAPGHAHDHHSAGHGATAGVLGLTLGALGIVYGDIGTSPLYAIREALAAGNRPITEARILGVGSLAFWALILVITVKYLLLVMRADNNGEGGILALTALVLPKLRERSGRLGAFLLLGGIFGTSLLYGDGMLTPAISVVSAVEGFKVASPVFADWVVPVSIAILVSLFFVQRRGTGTVGRIFGPIICVWFVALGGLGIASIAQTPEVLRAMSPTYAISYLSGGGWGSILVLGSIFLVVTGGEALYADMGHFGRRPISIGWFSLVLPGLVLNYLGQCALMLRDAATAENPFYLLAPDALIVPLAVLATMASVIASQALISGCFSLTVQAVQLDYLPRIAIRHTSATQAGQVYVPIVNWILMVCCVGIVVIFRTSSNMASAYGLAVTGTMAVTTMLFMAVARWRWQWPIWKIALFVGPLFALDLVFMAANVAKVPDGGWFPLAIGVAQLTLMTTWKRGRELVNQRIKRGAVPIENLMERLDRNEITRIPGTSVFLFKDARVVPPAMITNLEHNQVLHERVLLVRVVALEVPRVVAGEQVAVEAIGHGFWEVEVRHGFIEEPDVPAALGLVEIDGERIDPMAVSYVLGRETAIVSNAPGMAIWREHLFDLQNRSASSAARFFRLPSNRVFEVGSHVDI